MYLKLNYILKLGPPLPKGLASHSMVKLGENLYTVGGFFHDEIDEFTKFSESREIQKLTCVSGTCSWTTLTQQLKVGRGYTVAIPVKDSFCTPK